MSEPASLNDVERELDRVVDRLMSMPLARADAAAPAVRDAAQSLLAQCRLLDSGIPAEATIPELGPAGRGALIAVLGRDWLTAARTTDEPDAEAVLGILVTLRRALP